MAGEPNLELPSLFRRKKQPGLPADTAETSPAAPVPPAARLSRLSALPATALTGLVVGLLGVGLVAGLARGCDAVLGVPSCGGVAGLLLQLLTLTLMLLAGAWLLRRAGVVEPLTTAFLGVGLTAIVALVFLVPVLFEWWMAIVIPLLALGCFLVAYWVTSRSGQVRIVDDAHR